MQAKSHTRRPTKHIPRLGQARLVARVHDKHHRMAFVIVPRPDGADIALATEVEKVERSGRQRDLANW